jgi:hypothetical protein
MARKNFKKVPPITPLTKVPLLSLVVKRLAIENDIKVKAKMMILPINKTLYVNASENCNT